jgi:hypothetical protein
MDTEARWWRLLRKAGIGWSWNRHAFYAVLILGAGIYMLVVGRWYGIFALLLAILFGAIALAQFRWRER